MRCPEINPPEEEAPAADEGMPEEEEQSEAV